MLTVALVLALAQTARADTALLRRLWPQSIPMPQGMQAYTPTQYGQRSVNNDNAPLLTAQHVTKDDYFANAPPVVNPNRQFPYVKPGGLHAASGFRSLLGVAIPEGKAVRVWQSYYQTAAPRPFVHWEFPTGTVFADLLVNTETGKPFELRLLRKTADGWKASAPWQDDQLPSGYTVADRKCITCHRDAGDHTKYGLGLRGGDFIYSWQPFREGTVLLRRDLLDAGIVTIQPR
jgi:hypothetical protein